MCVCVCVRTHLGHTIEKPSKSESRDSLATLKLMYDASAKKLADEKRHALNCQRSYILETNAKNDHNIFNIYIYIHAISISIMCIHYVEIYIYI